MLNLSFILRTLVPAYDVVYQTSLYPKLIHKRSFQAELFYRYIPITFFLNWAFNLIPYIGNMIMPILILLGAWHLSKEDELKEKKQSQILYLLIAQWAFLGIWSFVGHTFLADFVATSIGWETGSPFQIELAFYHLGIALATFSLLWSKSIKAIGAIIIAKSTFQFGAMGVHIYHLISNNNLHSNNIGFGIIFADLIFPIIVIWLFVRLNKSR